ncbi:hypothetical protein ACOQFB_01125 [Anaeromyxobacter sp. Red801]|uniref:hypothetical protein n=1 Tax=Anaeromyxobacter sp. Red801 TaxID=3411632 RepID=UPI003BA1BF62
MTQLLPFAFDTIHTLEARSNVFLEVTAKHFELSDDHVFALIHLLLKRLRAALSSKGIEYERLRPALTPSIDRDEHAFVFDSAECHSSLYGREAIRTILPLLDRDSTHSVLCGDWLPSRGSFAEWAELSRSCVASLPSCLGGRGDTLYFVYLNHLTPTTTARLHATLQQSSFYLGYLDLTLASPLKACLATTLVRECIKHRRIILRAHEDDRDDSEDVDLSLFEFATLGFTVRSVPAMLYGPFLSYKIERPVLKGELDIHFSLNALTPAPLALRGFDVVLEPSKLEYLRTHKRGSLESAGLHELDPQEFARQIRAKVEANYIYRLARSADGTTLKFNVVAEFAGARTVCALEYIPAERRLRVITLY